MAEALEEERKAEWHKLRVHAWMVAVYSGLSMKDRRKLSPEKMLKIERNHEDPDPEEIEKWKDFFKRPVIKKEKFQAKNGFK